MRYDILQTIRMSQDSQLEEGIAEQVPGEVSERKLLTVMLDWLLNLLSKILYWLLFAVLVKLQKLRGPEFMYAMSLSLIQYLLRVIRTYYLFTQATGVSGILAEAPWAIVGFNILLYMQGGHVFGALWYFYAIAKVTACWKKACKNNTGCDHSSFNCEDRSTRDYTFLNDFCNIKSGNTSNYNFGLYKDAIESGIVEVTNFPKKLLHCLQWGLQNLSAFGQNLKTSTDIWENIFAICMTNFGVLLFVFLIGKMQSDTARSHMIRKKWKEIKQWPNFGEISSDVREQLRKYKQEKWQETKRVDVDNLVNDLPRELGNKIKRKLCIKLIKNPVFFIERTRIIREGDPIDEMIFVLKGKLWTYTSRNETTTTSNSRCRREDLLKHGDFFGGELIAWARDEHSSNIPISKKTIQPLTDVEAFTVMAQDLEHVLILSSVERSDGAARLLQSYWRFRKFFREIRKARQKSHVRKALNWAAKELQ
ncbi:cyclic nucleotide-gated ion channel 1 [Citrus sinensis]|uniref:Cyclic nucleotide-gated ion channel 1 n=1 Tax=Citrus sinensis TaxID=2711 RepID=A0ACB8HR39_CITSI|nr:cyclic nucleotide-gated ion channel 1 [Citrus sinensis]